MESRRENGWQYGREAFDCHRYMLENEVATDVCFDVGLTDDTLVRIWAHRYMLISRSEVFEAMFSSGMAEAQRGTEARIRIEDIEPDIFKEMLRFLYFDSADINATSALELLYAAKKYMLPNLVQLCSECLQKNLTAENVFRILNQSLLFDLSDLTKKCIELVEHDSSEVLKPENLQNASRQTMETILPLDSLEEDETVIYDACVNWAKAQLKILESVDHPNDQQIRTMLGNLIYDIRFPTMDAKAFAKLIESSNVLSYEEHSSIVCYIINNHKKETMKFNCKERFWQWKHFDEEHFVDRCASSSRIRWKKSGHDAIDVKTDRTILVTGLGLFPETGYKTSGYTVDLEILRSTISVFRMSTFVPSTENSTPRKVLFTTPVIMEHGILYTIIANSYSVTFLEFSELCRPICHVNNVTFTFSDTTCRDSNGTGIYKGQIPQIYFKGPK